MTDEILGLTPDQHQRLGRLERASRAITRPATGLGAVNGKYPGVARVIIIDDTDPVYSPLEVRDVGIFRRNPSGVQKTIEMVGTNLEGDIVLTIDGTDYQVPCNATTAELRAAIGLSITDCRATAFYGLWEFDFNYGRWASDAPSFSVDAFEPPPEDTETPVFDGGLILTDEGWVSATDDGDTYKTIETNDWVPFLTGAVKRGSIGLAHWSHEAGWLSSAWQCREISFAADPY